MEHDQDCERQRVSSHIWDDGWRDVNLLKRIFSQGVLDSVSCFCAERARDSSWSDDLGGLVAATRTKMRFWAEERRIGGKEAVQLIAEKMGAGNEAEIIEVDFQDRRVMRRW